MAKLIRSLRFQFPFQFTALVNVFSAIFHSLAVFSGDGTSALWQQLLSNSLGLFAASFLGQQLTIHSTRCSNQTTSHTRAVANLSAHPVGNLPSFATHSIPCSLLSDRRVDACENNWETVGKGNVTSHLWNCLLTAYRVYASRAFAFSALHTRRSFTAFVLFWAHLSLSYNFVCLSAYHFACLCR